MKIKSFVISGVVILFGTICAAGFYLRQGHWKTVAGLESASNLRIWDAVSCRAQLYLRKLQGGIPELSWTELWALTVHPELGFHCTEGRSMEAELRYSEGASEHDRSAGARIFRERCAGCHGTDGSGGPHAPSLTRFTYKHGDSDLAIYKVLRDGVSGTAMPSAGLPLRELLQVTASVKMLQAHLPEDHKPEAASLSIQVSNEGLRTAEANPNEWLMYSGSYNGWRHTSLTSPK
jgi:alcohol dehydrogenase (cytochrome c)